jgi:enamine deaminase RidA (YjgF/YER057c/UK114 family)
MIYRDLIIPGTQTSLEKAVEECLLTMQARLLRGRLLGVNCFVHCQSDADYFLQKEFLSNQFEMVFPGLPLGVVAQSPESKLAVEFWLTDVDTSIGLKSANGFRYSLVEEGSGRWLFAPGLAVSDPALSISRQAEFAFEAAVSVLAAEGFTFDEVVRQWNYIPEIVRCLESDGLLLQHYQLFNDVRQRYYKMHLKNTDYPAATGIGMSYGTVCIDLLALQCADDIHRAELTNPRQINAYEYHSDLLIGSKPDKKKPLFARAKLVGTDDQALCFISGTASIIGEESVGKGDVATQVVITRDNILRLVTPENLIRHEQHAYPELKIIFNRVYVKSPDHLQEVKALCNRIFPKVPTIFLQAEVCRDELLVEIESECILSL